ncbi:MAG: hypothetical protein K8S94_13420 [Planctomycetia bacterium]|nr:hypothetical protein [Planctomycetia bacterium]
MVSIAEPMVVSLHTLSLEAVRSLLTPHPAPCLSLYLPTHRKVPDNTVDLPSFRHLVGGFEMALSASHPRDEIERLVRPFHLLASDAQFWQHTRDGLAVLASDGKAQVFLLQRSVKPLAVVTGRFHLMPLVRIALSLEHCHVLALTSREARVYEGTFWHDTTGGAIDHLDPVEVVSLRGREPTEVLVRGDVIDEETFQPHRVERGLGPAGMAGTTAVHGGAGSKHDDIDADTEIFLRHVDLVVREQVSHPTGLPLVLVAGPRISATFRGLSKNDLLLEDHVAKDPHLMSNAELAAAVTPVFVAAAQARVDRELCDFARARDRDLAATDLADVGRAAVAGRVATLLFEADRLEAGRFDRTTGAVAFDGAASRDPSRSGGRPLEAEDLYGALAETVLLHGGTVMPLPRIAMPTESGVAAIYRY